MAVHANMTLSSDADRVRLLVLDVDGVLTDGTILIADSGAESKRFHVRDGCGLRLWMALGYDVAVLTGRVGMSLRHRLDELGIEHLVNGSKDKGRDVAELCARLGRGFDQTAMVGDDIPDLPALRLVGYPIAVADAAAEVRAIARFTTARAGGQGAVREAIEHLLTAQKRWDEAVAYYDSADSATAAPRGAALKTDASDSRGPTLGRSGANL
ncbi:MAG: HAD hydrolase family protein [Phycisphaerae bacterium]|nr:HAD hydrolase family protein [Phycisphaerae bacterium]